MKESQTSKREKRGGCSGAAPLLDILDHAEQMEQGRWEVALNNLKAVYDKPDFMSWATKRNWAIERELVRAEAAIDTIKLLRHVLKVSNVAGEPR